MGGQQALHGYIRIGPGVLGSGRQQLRDHAIQQQTALGRGVDAAVVAGQQAVGDQVGQGGGIGDQGFRDALGDPEAQQHALLAGLVRGKGVLGVQARAGFGDALDVVGDPRRASRGGAAALEGDAAVGAGVVDVMGAVTNLARGEVVPAAIYLAAAGAAAWLAPASTTLSATGWDLASLTTPTGGASDAVAVYPVALTLRDL